jgi:translocation and assembly module TamA
MQVALLLLVYLAVSLPEQRVSAKPSGLDYRVTITGVGDKTLQKSLEDISDTLALRKERPPMTLPMLRRRAEGDISRFLKALRAEGYYGARVTPYMNAEAKPISVVFEVDMGSPYLLKKVEIETARQEEALAAKLPSVQELGFTLGEPGRSRVVLDGEERLLQILKGQGFPFPEIAGRKVTVDHRDHSVAVVFRLEPGPAARFGPTEIRGLESVDKCFVRNKIPWQEGDTFNAELVERAKKGLIRSGLFAMARVDWGERLDVNRQLPITVTVVERPHRSVGAGISYKTDEKLGVKMSWEHRNLFSGGERLGLSAHLSDFTRAAEGTFGRPHFRRRDQDLVVNCRLAEDRPDAYRSRSFRSEAILERGLGKDMMGSAGLGVKASKVEQLDEEKSFELLFLLLGFHWDTSDEPLDPRRGGRLAVQITPYYDGQQTDFAFFKGQASLSRYLELLASPSLVLAGRMAAGVITGASLEGVPADERFYAGGGGSIRGYPYQSVGPLEDGEPLGGRSLLEVSTEMRLKMTERLGLVGFLDGGTAFEQNTPEFGGDLLWGVGLGLRYFTPIGPFRLDVAVPLDKRSDVDDDFQVYVSLQHAF